jgi:antitoxin CptB
MAAPLDNRRKRLLFRSWHRGTKEADLLMGSFAEAKIAAFSEAELAEYEALVETDDATLLDWLTGRAVPPPEALSAVLRQLLDFRYRPRPS